MILVKLAAFYSDVILAIVLISQNGQIGQVYRHVNYNVTGGGTMTFRSKWVSAQALVLGAFGYRRNLGILKKAKKRR